MIRNMELILKSLDEEEYYMLIIPLQKGFDVLNQVYKYDLN